MNNDGLSPHEIETLSHPQRIYSVVDKNDSSSLHILNYNCCSLINKILDIETFLEQLPISIDLMIRTEHWFFKKYADLLRVKNYTVGSNYTREMTTHGGVTVLVRSDHKCQSIDKIENMSIEGCCELSAIVMQPESLFAIGVYRPPAGDFDLFMDTMDRVLYHMFNKQRVILAGDFNVHFNDACCQKYQKLENLLISYGFYHTSIKPTHGSNCLDNIYINFKSKQITSLTMDPGFSDHLGQILNLQLPRTDHQQSYISRRAINANGIEKIRNILFMNDWSFILDDYRSVDERWCDFISMFLSSIDIVAPLKKIKLKRLNKTNGSLGSWYTSELRILRDCLRIFKTATNVFSSETLTKCTKALRSFYRKEIRAAKKRSYDHIISYSNNPVKTMWRIINERREDTKKSTIEIPPDELNNYFTDMASDILKTIPASSHNPLSFSGSSQTEKFSFTTVQMQDVWQITKKLKRSAARDTYGLDVNLLIDCVYPIIPQLTNLINLILITSTFPDCLKIAMVKPVFKNGDRRNRENYRPISLLPAFSKIIEGIMKAQLTTHLEDHLLITQDQYGFRTGRSTGDAILSLTSDIMDAFEKGDSYSATFLDLSRAFDCISHEILISKLSKYGLDKQAVSLITSYLTNRVQYVEIEGVNSALRKVENGVPQGSILGPLLFLTYINDLPNFDDDLRFHIFADDTTVSFTEKNHDQIREKQSEMLPRISNWFAANNLAINQRKTKNMVFSLRNVSEFENPASLRFLGVHLDDRLLFRSHVESISNKINKGIFVLRSLKDTSSREVLKMAYYGLIHPHLTYAVVSWGHTPLAQKHIFKLQRRAVRIVDGIGYRADCGASFLNNDILTFPSIYILGAIMDLHGNPLDLNTGSDIHQHLTRNSHLLRVDFLRLQRTRNSKNYWSPTLYNCLPLYVRSWNASKLKTRLKRYLIAGTFYSLSAFINSDFNEFPID